MKLHQCVHLLAHASRGSACGPSRSSGGFRAMTHPATRSSNRSLFFEPTLDEISRKPKGTFDKEERLSPTDRTLTSEDNRCASIR